MSKNQLLKHVGLLIKSFRTDGEERLADGLEGMTSDYLIWDQMVLRLSEFLTNVATEHRLSEQTSCLVKALASQLRPPKFTHDEGVYGPSKVIAADLARIGLNEWAHRITEAMEAGSTSSEIYMSLRQIFTNILLSSIALPYELRNRVTKMRDDLARALA